MAPPSEVTFGELLRQLRKAAGLTQAELAERAGLSVRGLNDLERGARRTPRRDTVMLLGGALDLVGEERAAFLAAARRASTLPAAMSLTTNVDAGHEEWRGQDPEAVLRANGHPSYSVDAPILPPSGTVTFLFAAIDGLAHLLQHDRSHYANALATQQLLLHSTFAAHGGYEVARLDDSLLVAFPTAPSAL